MAAICGRPTTLPSLVTRFFFDFFHRDFDAQFLQLGNDAGVAIVATGDQRGGQIFEDRAAWIDSISEDVHVSRMGKFSGDLDTGQKIQTDFFCLGGGFSDAIDGVGGRSAPTR